MYYKTNIQYKIFQMQNDVVNTKIVDKIIRTARGLLHRIRRNFKFPFLSIKVSQRYVSHFRLARINQLESYPAASIPRSENPPAKRRAHKKPSPEMSTCAIVVALKLHLCAACQLVGVQQH